MYAYGTISVFRWGGGDNIFCSNLSFLPESRIMLANAFLSNMGGGGGGGRLLKWLVEGEDVGGVSPLVTVGIFFFFFFFFLGGY